MIDMAGKYVRKQLTSREMVETADCALLASAFDMSGARKDGDSFFIPIIYSERANHALDDTAYRYVSAFNGLGAENVMKVVYPNSKKIEGVSIDAKSFPTIREAIIKYQKELAQVESEERGRRH